MNMLTTKQHYVVNLATKCHNLVVCGQAGTGKSHIIPYVVIEPEKMDKKVAVTSTTGLATQNCPCHLKPMTTHHWCGIQDGRFGNIMTYFSGVQIFPIYMDDSTLLNNIRQTRVKDFGSFCY